MKPARLALMAVTMALLALLPGTPGAQPASKVYRVGVLHNGVRDDAFEVLRKELERLGYVEGTNLVFEARFAEGQLGRLPGFAADLADKGVDVIAAYGGPATTAARKATSTIPVVAAPVADPFAIGAAAATARPGGNTTGITNHDPELAGRQLGLLRELVPGLRRIAIVSDPEIPGADASGLAPIERDFVAAAKAAGVSAEVVKVGGASFDYEAAFRSMVQQGVQGLLVLQVPAAIRDRKRIAELSAVNRLPSVFWGGGSDAGGLMSYGTSLAAMYPHVPAYVDRIFKGARPAETPYETVTSRELVINNRTAQRLGLAIPEAMRKRANRIIE